MLAELFFTFAKIGLFTFGGGYAMIAQIKETVVEQKGWLDEEELMQIITVAESTPGPIAINMATYVGYKKKGVAGSPQARRDGNTQQVSRSTDSSEGQCRAEVHHDTSTLITAIGLHRIAQQVAADLMDGSLRNSYRQQGKDCGIDDYRLPTRLLLDEAHEGANQHRHHGAYDAIFHILHVKSIIPQQGGQHTAILVTRPPDIRKEPPGGQDDTVPEQGHYNIRVSDVYSQKQLKFSPNVSIISIWKSSYNLEFSKASGIFCQKQRLPVPA